MRTRKHRALRSLGAAGAIAALLAGCALPGSSDPPRHEAPVVATPVASGSPATRYLLALGDSYAVGYQPGRGTTNDGPADQLVRFTKARGYRFTLVNLGCAGATTSSLLSQLDCPADGRAPGSPGYPGRTQLQAAVDFITAHPGQVRLVTVSIGGNDVTACLVSQDPLACTRTAMRSARANLTTAVTALRAAGGPRLRIVGSTYPDVVLGSWVRGDLFGEHRFRLATQSLAAFKHVINPQLRRAYRSGGGQLVDVTAATGAYGSFAAVPTQRYGEVPRPVARVCRLSYFCSDLDIHLTTRGYGIIARLQARTLPRR